MIQSVNRGGHFNVLPTIPLYLYTVSPAVERCSLNTHPHPVYKRHISTSSLDDNNISKEGWTLGIYKGTWDGQEMCHVLERY